MNDDLIEKLSFESQKLMIQQQMLLETQSKLMDVDESDLSVESKSALVSLIMRDETSLESNVIQSVKDALKKIWEHIKNVFVRWYVMFKDFMTKLLRLRKDLHKEINDIIKSITGSVNKYIEKHGNVPSDVTVDFTVPSYEQNVLLASNTFNFKDVVNEINETIPKLRHLATESCMSHSRLLIAAKTDIPKLSKTDTGFDVSMAEWKQRILGFENELKDVAKGFPRQGFKLLGNKEIRLIRDSETADTSHHHYYALYGLQIVDVKRGYRRPSSAIELKLPYAEITQILTSLYTLHSENIDLEENVTDLAKLTSDVKDVIDKTVADRVQYLPLDNTRVKYYLKGMMDTVNTRHVSHIQEMVRYEHRVLQALLTIARRIDINMKEKASKL